MPDFDPVKAAAEQRLEAEEYFQAIETPNLPRVPWSDLDFLVGPLLPGFLIAVGGRPKAGKTSFLLGWASGCADRGVPFHFVTTEMRAAQCKATWAATRLGLWRGLGHRLADGERHQVKREMARLAVESGRSVVFRDMPSVTPAGLTHAVVEAADLGAKVFFFDYFQRLNTGANNKWEALSDAICQAKETAKSAQMVTAMAAQLHAGKDRDPISKFLVPTDGDWWGGPGPQQEADVALQLWRPLKPDLERGIFQRYRRGEVPAKELAAAHTMGIRCSGHRWIADSNDEIRRLHIQDGRIDCFARPSEVPDDVEDRYEL